MRPAALVPLLFALATAGPTAFAHPIHSSLAEADYNRASQTLEVSVRVFADDLEQALTPRAGRKISLEKTPVAELDALIRSYLAAAFTVTLRSGAAAPLRWIGRDLKDGPNELWLFFAASLPDGPDGVRLGHRLLVETFSDQLNSVHIRDGPRKTTLLFLRGDGTKPIRFAP